MTKEARSPSRRKRPPRRFKIGLEEAIAIGRVEGLEMPRDMRRTFERFERSGLSHEARRAELIEKYGRKGG